MKSFKPNEEYIVREISDKWTPKYHLIAIQNPTTGKLELRDINKFYAGEFRVPQEEILEKYSIETPFDRNGVANVVASIQIAYNAGGSDDIIDIATAFKHRINKGLQFNTFGENRLMMRDYANIEWILHGATKGLSYVEYMRNPAFNFAIGQSVMLQDGTNEVIIGRTFVTGYESVIIAGRNYEHIHLYDRSTGKSDMGRVCGTCIEYRDPRNILRDDYGNRYALFNKACSELMLDTSADYFSRIMPRPAKDKAILDIMGGSVLDMIK